MRDVHNHLPRHRPTVPNIPLVMNSLASLPTTSTSASICDMLIEIIAVIGWGMKSKTGGAEMAQCVWQRVSVCVGSAIAHDRRHSRLSKCLRDVRAHNCDDWLGTARFRDAALHSTILHRIAQVPIVESMPFPTEPSLNLGQHMDDFPTRSNNAYPDTTHASQNISLVVNSLASLRATSTSASDRAIFK